MEAHGAVKVDKKKIVLVPDIYNNIRILKCNRKPPENPSSLFPYDRFQFYLSCLNEIERCQRSEAVFRGEDVSPIEFYNDNYLKTEFSSIYGGGLDEDHPNFIKIFDNYKEERLEEIQEWIQDENVIKAAKKMGQVSINILPPNLSKLFSVEEIKLFDTVKMGPVSGHEWFNLPRKALSTAEIASLKATKLLNLALFDPELSDYEGTRVIPPQAISREDRGISEKLALNIYEIMCRHPAGISSDEFSIEYNRKFKYSPNYRGLGYNNFVEFLIDLNHVVFTQSRGPNNHFMMYPTYLENLIATPMDTFWKIYHKLIIILQLFDGACKTEVLVQFFQDLYHIKLPLKTSWGFNNVDEFVVYLINNVKWNNDFYKVEKASVIDGKADAVGHYVVHMTPARERAIQEKKISNMNYVKLTTNSASSYFRATSSSSSHPPPQIPPIPKQFAQLDDHIPSESDFVKANMEDIYVVPYYTTPTDFEIVRKQTWESMKVDRKLSEFYTALRTNPDGLQPANPKTFKAGLLLVVYDCEYSDYVRARYVKVASKFRCHQVHLLDVGGYLEVHQDNIYYMHMSVMKQIKAQVIRAGLSNVQSTIRNSVTEEWSSEVIDYAFGLMVPKDKSPRLRVQFVSYQRNNGGKWLVSVKLGPQKRLQDVGQAIMNFQSLRKEEKTKLSEAPAHHHYQKVLKAPVIMDPTANISSDPVIEQTDFLPSSETDVTAHDPSTPTVVTPSSCLTETEGQATAANGNISKISSPGTEWRSSTNTEGSVQQKKPSYQPRSYADTAASSTWRCQPNEPNRNFGAESNAFPTLAESVNAKTVPKRTTGTPTQSSSSFSYANIASSRNAKQ